MVANAFADGISHFITFDKIITDETSRFHRASSLKFSNNLKSVCQTPAGKAVNAIIAIIKLQHNRVKLLMRYTQAIIVNARPFTGVTWMCQ